MDEPSAVGTVLADKYRLEHELGRGGYGAVYQATHLQTDGPVAIKRVHKSLAESQMVLNRLLAEAKNTHKLSHPTTVRVSDFGEVPGGGLYLAMEYVEGRPLASVIRTEVPMPVLWVVRITSQILKALGEVIHRGITAHNIPLIDRLRIDSFGAPDFVKVLDRVVTGGPAQRSRQKRGPCVWVTARIRRAAPWGFAVANTR